MKPLWHVHRKMLKLQQANFYLLFRTNKKHEKNKSKRDNHTYTIDSHYKRFFLFNEWLLDKLL